MMKRAMYQSLTIERKLRVYQQGRQFASGNNKKFNDSRFFCMRKLLLIA